MEEYKKKYEDALDNFKKIKATNKDNKELVDFIEYKYPELKESEDERIRKAIFKALSKKDARDVLLANGIQVSDALAWLEKPKYTEEDLDKAYKCADEVQYRRGYEDAKKEIEKQGEQKPADKIELKFHAGDFITDGERIFQIKETVWERNNRNDGITYCESLIVNLRDGVTYANNTDLKEYHLWTIQDAKDGDVLAVNDDTIIIFKNLYNGSTFHSFCHIENDIFRISKDDMPDWWSYKGFHPATKEQCDLLFQKMKEAGYDYANDYYTIKPYQQ